MWAPISESSEVFLYYLKLHKVSQIRIPGVNKWSHILFLGFSLLSQMVLVNIMGSREILTGFGDSLDSRRDSGHSLYRPLVKTAAL